MPYDNQNQSTYMYGTMRWDGEVGTDSDELCLLTEYKNHIIETENLPVIRENKG